MVTMMVAAGQGIHCRAALSPFMGRANSHDRVRKKPRAISTNPAIAVLIQASSGTTSSAG